jgi:perosamine synthetase
MMKVFDKGFIPMSEPSITSLERRRLKKAINSGWVSSSGPFIDEIDSKLAKCLNVKHATTVSNGTVALHLALYALGIGPGDEVIVPNLSFIAVPNSVCYLGATVVLCDIDQTTLGLSASELERKITTKTKAIIAVHNYGFMSDMRKIMEIARVAKIPVIEDTSEAIFLKVGETFAGTYGDISTFSFYGNKIVTSGEGGAIASASPEIIEKIKYLKNQAANPNHRFYFPDLGFNFRMTNLQAALLSAQLDRREYLLESRQTVFKNYVEKKWENIDWANPILPDSLSEVSPWAFSVKMNENLDLSLSKVLSYFRKNGFDSRPFFHPLSKNPRFADGANYPISESIALNSFNLPTYPNLKNHQIKKIFRTIESAPIHLFKND